LSIFRRVTDEEECETCTESVRLESSPRHKTNEESFVMGVSRIFGLRERTRKG